MLYSAIKGMCSIRNYISTNGSIESPETVHYRAFLQSHHQNGQDVKESHEKTVNLEMLWRWNKNKCFILLKKVEHWKTNCRIVYSRF